MGGERWDAPDRIRVCVCVFATALNLTLMRHSLCVVVVQESVNEASAEERMAVGDSPGLQDCFTQPASLWEEDREPTAKGEGGGWRLAGGAGHGRAGKSRGEKKKRQDPSPPHAIHGGTNNPNAYKSHG